MKGPLRYFNSSPEAIRLKVMLYIRYPPSLLQAEYILFGRGIDTCWFDTMSRPRSGDDAFTTGAS